MENMKFSWFSFLSTQSSSKKVKKDKTITIKCQYVSCPIVLVFCRQPFMKFKLLLTEILKKSETEKFGVSKNLFIYWNISMKQGCIKLIKSVSKDIYNAIIYFCFK